MSRKRCWEVNTHHTSVTSFNCEHDTSIPVRQIHCLRFAKCTQNKIFPKAPWHRSHLHPSVLKRQTGVGPFGAKFLLRIKLTHQNKLLVALEAPGGLASPQNLGWRTAPTKTGSSVWGLRGTGWLDSCPRSDRYYRNTCQVLHSRWNEVNLTHD